LDRLFISGKNAESKLEQNGFIILKLDEAEVREIYSLKQDHNELSLDDFSLFFMGQKHQMMILSNDGLLRELADKARIEYHGTFWLLEEMIQTGILPAPEAATALGLMLKNKRWLPRSECEHQVQKWDTMQ
jgi:hypothetical protein